MSMSESAPVGEADSGKSGTANNSTECPDCGKQYNNIKGVRYHLKNTKCSALTCDYCQADHLLSDRGIKAHIKEKHGFSILDGKHECPTCDRTYNVVTQLRNHMRDCCPNNLERCPTCGELFYNMAGVKQHHSRTHNEKFKRVFNCDWCGKENEVNPSRKDARFCDRDCHGKWRSKNLIGDESPLWKDYDGYYGPNWTKQKRKALKRDQYRCQRCLKSENELGQKPDVHHLKRMGWYHSEYGSPEWYERGNEIENLVCLCRSCHGEWEGIPLRPDTR